jgi:translocator protein
MSRDILRQFFTIVAFVATLVFNGLASSGQLNGIVTAAVSDRLPILFVPAGYVFGIWGLIYSLLLGFVIFQALPRQRENPLLRSIGYWFIISCVFNAIWLVFFHYFQFAWSMVAMVGVLVSLIMVYVNVKGHARTRAESIWVVGAFSVYLGWITVATVANASYVLYDMGWDGFGLNEANWASIMLVVAALVAGFIAYTRRDWAYSAVLVWALVGIIVKQAPVSQQVGITAGLMIPVIVGALALGWWMARGNGGSSGRLQAA